jgi:hypothetical protein
MNSVLAISEFVRPAATSLTTSRSRSVSAEIASVSPARRQCTLHDTMKGELTIK